MSTMLADVKAKFKKVVQDFENEKIGIVAAKDSLLTIALDNNLAYKLKLPARFVGVHPSNRNGEGLEPNRVHTRGGLIVQSGWSWSAINDNSICIEDSPNKAIAKFTIGLTKMSPKFASYDEKEVKAGSLGAGHANHWLACLAQQVPCEVANISEHGKMSPSKCCKDIGVKEAMEHGLNWLVIRWEVEADCPTIPFIIQGALNAQASTHEGANFVQCLLQIVDEARVLTKAGSVRWADVAKRVAKAQPARAADVPSMIEYTKVWGGLPSGGFIRELNECCKQFVPSDRLVSPQIFKTLGGLRFSPTELPAHFVNAAIFTHAASKEGVQDNYARYISKAEFESLATKNKVAVLKADQILVRAAKVADTSTLDRTSKLKAIGNLKQHIVMSVLGKLHPPATVEDIASDFCKAITGGMPDVAEDEHKPGSSTEVSNSNQNVVQYQDGQAIGVGRMTVINRGFQVGSMVMSRGAPTSTYRIDSIADDGSVKLRQALEDGSFAKSTIEKSLDVFVEQFRPTKTTHELLAGWPEKDGSTSEDITAMLNKSLASIALVGAIRDNATPKLRIVNKPTRRVMASASYKEQSLRLAPVSTFLSPIDAGAVSAHPVVKLPDCTFQVRPMTRPDFIGAIWCLRVVHSKAEANMELIPKTYKVRSASAKELLVAVEVELASNFKAIKVDDELVLFKPKVEVAAKHPKRALAVIGMDNEAKKAKP
jgi:hypothetical protein